MQNEYIENGALVRDETDTGNDAPCPTMPPANYGYELTAFITALLLVVGFGLLLPMIEGNLKQLPFGVIGVAFLMGALLAYHHQHHGRFWLFTVSAVLLTVGGVK